MSSVTRTVVVANVRSLPIQWFRPVRARIRLAIKLAGREGVTCFAECGPDRKTKARLKRNRRSYASIVVSEAKRAGKNVYGWDSEIPMVLDADVWEVLSHQMVFAHAGLKHVSPNRWINQVVARHRRDRGVMEVDGAHGPSKGHYPDGAKVDHLEWRQQHLAIYMDREASLAAGSWAAGRTHVFAGDLNDPTPEKISPHQHSLNSAGLDHIIAVPAPGNWFSGIRRGRVAKTKAMDHPIITATFTEKGN